MINAARLQIEHLGREEPGQPDGPRRADDDLSKFFPLNVIENLENRREAEFLQFVFGQFEFADGFEILDRDIVCLQLAARNDDD